MRQKIRENCAVNGRKSDICHRPQEFRLRMPIAVTLTVIAILAAHTAHASTIFAGSVSKVGIYGDGSFFFILSGAAINEPGCTTGQARVDIDATHSQRKEILSMVLTAKAMGKALQGSVDGCSNGFPTIGNSKSSYIYTED